MNNCITQRKKLFFLQRSAISQIFSVLTTPPHCPPAQPGEELGRLYTTWLESTLLLSAQIFVRLPLSSSVLISVFPNSYFGGSVFKRQYVQYGPHTPHITVSIASCQNMGHAFYYVIQEAGSIGTHRIRILLAAPQYKLGRHGSQPK